MQKGIRNNTDLDELDHFKNVNKVNFWDYQTVHWSNKEFLRFQDKWKQKHQEKERKCTVIYKGNEIKIKHKAVTSI